jgi:WD40 repeat protein
VTLSQVAYLASGKVFFAGVGEDCKPGAVQIWKSSLEKVCDVQAHSKAIERMRLSFDNNYLITAGRDGTLIIHDVKDRDPRGGVNKRDFGDSLNFSDEILTEKTEMEEFDNQKETAENEL